MPFLSRGPAWGRPFIPLPLGPPAQLAAAGLPSLLALPPRQVRPVQPAGAGHRHCSGELAGGLPWAGAWGPPAALCTGTPTGPGASRTARGGLGSSPW